MVTTLLALELERSRSPEWESEEVAGAFVAGVLAREVTDRGDIVARGGRARRRTSSGAPACWSSAPRRGPRRPASGGHG